MRDPINGLGTLGDADIISNFIVSQYKSLRDWSLITGRGGGGYKTEGGACKVLPL